MNKEFDARTKQYRKEIEAYLQAFYDGFRSEPQALLFDAIRYSLFSGGKRLRSIFTLEFCRMCGVDYHQAMPFAAAVEMIQTYSLIHDDLPCMDDDDLRRGKPTNHKVFGEAMAVLAGDALLTDAFAVAASAQLPDPAQMALAIGVLANNAGSLGMVGGQALDVQSEERVLTEQEVLDIQTRKTGALINSACVLGVLAAGGSHEQVQAAAQFAGCLGLAFQIRDDMLDVVGTAEEMGKGVGTDEKKNTFVRLFGLEECERMVVRYTEAACDALNRFPDHGYMTELALSLTTRRA